MQRIQTCWLSAKNTLTPKRNWRSTTALPDPRSNRYPNKTRLDQFHPDNVFVNRIVVIFYNLKSRFGTKRLQRRRFFGGYHSLAGPALDLATEKYKCGLKPPRRSVFKMHRGTDLQSQSICTYQTAPMTRGGQGKYHSLAGTAFDSAPEKYKVGRLPSPHRVFRLEFGVEVQG